MNNIHVGCGAVPRLSCQVRPKNIEEFATWAEQYPSRHPYERVVHIDHERLCVWLLLDHWTDHDPMYQTMRYLTGDSLYGITDQEIHEMVNHDKLAAEFAAKESQ